MKAVKEQVRNQVWFGVRNQVCVQVGDEVAAIIVARDQIWDPVYRQVFNQVLYQVLNQDRHVVRITLRSSQE